MSPILVAVCLAAQSEAADEKGIDFTGEKRTRALMESSGPVDRQATSTGRGLLLLVVSIYVSKK